MDRRLKFALAVGAGVLVFFLATSAAASSKAPRPPMTFRKNSMKFPKRSNKIRGIVIHHTVTGSAKSTQYVLEKRGLSTNYEVDQKGNIYEYNSPDNGFAQATGGNANRWLVAIDVTHLSGAPWPAAQVEATRQLVQWLAGRYNIALKLAPDGVRNRWDEGWAERDFTLFRHRNFVNTTCPEDFPMEQLLETRPLLA
jgi:hypothetical protein